MVIYIASIIRNMDLSFNKMPEEMVSEDLVGTICQIISAVIRKKDPH